MVNPTVAYNVDFRLKAFINDSVPELYSNTVNMAITPYSGAVPKFILWVTYSTTDGTITTHRCVYSLMTMSIICYSLTQVS